MGDSDQAISSAIVDAKISRFRNWIEKVGLDEKSHQISGMKFCLSKELDLSPKHNVRGGIIADEMGLGKTILMLGCIIGNFKDQVVSKNPDVCGREGGASLSNTLVVLPCSLLSQWDEIFKKFMGHSPLVYHGGNVKNITEDELSSAPVVLTTYGMISIVEGKKRSLLWRIGWNRVIVDEAHHLRNMDTGIFKGAMKLQANIRWMVTGTPIQNKKKDLYALCAVLGLKDAISTNTQRVYKVIGHHLLRRTKRGVGIKLPPLKKKTISVPWLSKEEYGMASQIHSQTHFSNVTVENVDFIIEKLTKGVLPLLVRARQMCVFPHLIRKAVRKLRQKGILPDDANLNDVKTCSKMTAVSQHLIQRANNDKRKIVFCHYRGEIDLLLKLLRDKGISCASIDGRTTKMDRELALNLDHAVSKREFSSVCRKWRDAVWHGVFEHVEKYMSPSVLVVQIQTSCEGLNLQHFQEILFTSPHWNPAVEDQAIARAYRIGQLKEVSVFHFIMENFENDSQGITLDHYCRYIQNIKREHMRLVDSYETDNNDPSEAVNDFADDVTDAI